MDLCFSRSCIEFEVTLCLFKRGNISRKMRHKKLNLNHLNLNKAAWIIALKPEFECQNLKLEFILCSWISIKLKLNLVFWNWTHLLVFYPTWTFNSVDSHNHFSQFNFSLVRQTFGLWGWLIEHRCMEVLFMSAKIPVQSVDISWHSVLIRTSSDLRARS